MSWPLAFIHRFLQQGLRRAPIMRFRTDGRGWDATQAVLPAVREDQRDGLCETLPGFVWGVALPLGQRRLEAVRCKPWLNEALRAVYVPYLNRRPSSRSFPPASSPP